MPDTRDESLADELDEIAARLTEPGVYWGGPATVAALSRAAQRLRRAPWEKIDAKATAQPGDGEAGATKDGEG